MKKLLIISAAVYLFSVIASYSSYAQSSTRADYAKNVVPDTGGFFKSNSPVKEENLSTVNPAASRLRCSPRGSHEGKPYRGLEAFGPEAPVEL